jgi:hypothetical protein
MKREEIHENGHFNGKMGNLWHFNGHLNGKIMNIYEHHRSILGDFPRKHVSFLVVNEFQLLVLDR